MSSFCLVDFLDPSDKLTEHQSCLVWSSPVWENIPAKPVAVTLPRPESLLCEDTEMELLKRELCSGVQVRWGLAKAGMNCLVSADYRLIYCSIEHTQVVSIKTMFVFQPLGIKGSF